MEGCPLCLAEWNKELVHLFTCWLFCCLFMFLFCLFICLFTCLCRLGVTNYPHKPKRKTPPVEEVIAILTYWCMAILISLV